MTKPYQNKDEIAQWFRQGLSNSEVAKKLGTTRHGAAGLRHRLMKTQDKSTPYLSKNNGPDRSDNLS